MRSNRDQPLRRCAANRGGRRAAGFTLMELLIVVLIIGVLASIIVPMVAKARQHAQAANTRALIANLSTLITAYQGDFNAYPGPLSNMQIATSLGGLAAPQIDPGTGPTATGANVTGAALGKITMSENLVLGLNGGLRWNRDLDRIEYNTAWVGQGPQWLGGTPKKLPAYGNKNNEDLSIPESDTAGTVDGDYVDNNGNTGDDTSIPEYVDRFNEPMPIIYLRARAGTRVAGTTYTPGSNPVITDGTNPARPGQYDYSQYAGYVSGIGGNIGVGKIISAGDYTVPADYGNPPNPKHGLRTVAVTDTTNASPPAGETYVYPYSAFAAFRNHALSGAPHAAPPDPADVPKQKDGYILISAGIDRVYGTSDDITNFGSY